jgi:hypothetical protein
VAVEAQALRAGHQLGTLGDRTLAGLVIEELDAELFQDPHRGIVDALDLLLAQHLDRLVRIAMGAPGQLFHAADGAAFAARALLSLHGGSFRPEMI